MSAEKLILPTGIAEMLNRLRAYDDRAGVSTRMGDLRAVADLLTATQADNERLRKALEPFAAAGRGVATLEKTLGLEPWPDGRVAKNVHFTHGQLRAAALAARSALPEQEEGK
jgi:hypothetical protein